MNRAAARRLFSSYFEGPAARVLAGLGLSPNVVTLLGLLVTGGGAYLLSIGQLAAGGVALLVSGVFDVLDGALARATGRESAFGALLDSTVDRISEAVALMGLLLFYLRRATADEMMVGALLVFVAMAGSFMVSYVRARAGALNVDCEVGAMTRPERVAVLAIGLIVGQWWQPAVLIALGLIAALTVSTTIQRVLHVRRVLSERRSGTSVEPDIGNG